MDALAKAGAKVKEAAPDIDTGRLHDVYIRLLRAATSARTTDAEIEDWKKAKADGDDAPILAQMLDGVTMPHRQWLKLNNERHHMRLTVQRVLQGLRHPALPGCGLRRVPARPRAPGQALAAQDHDRQQARILDRPVVLGRLLRPGLSALDGGTRGPDRVGPARRLSGDRRAGTGQDFHRLRPAGGQGQGRSRPGTIDPPEHDPEKCAAVSRLREALAGSHLWIDASAGEGRSEKIMLHE